MIEINSNFKSNIIFNFFVNILIYFTILFENDNEEHNIYLHDIRQSDYGNEINFKIYQNNYRKIKGNITFKITAYFNQYWLTSRIKDKKYLFKISIDNEMIEKELISKIYYEEKFESKWYQFFKEEDNIKKQLLTIPSIGLNYKSKGNEILKNFLKLEEFKSQNEIIFFIIPFL